MESSIKDITHLLPDLNRAPSDRPYITLTYAQTLDGSISSSTGGPLPISGAASLITTHRLRASHDGILVGIGTILADNPKLNVRLAEEHIPHGTTISQPRPIILDTYLRCPIDAKLFTIENRPCPIIIHGKLDTAAQQQKKEQLQSKGAILLEAGFDDKRLDLESVFQALGKFGIRSVMVEGGATVISKIIAMRLADKVIITMAPFFAAGIRAVQSLPQGGFPALDDVRYDRMGDDIVISGCFRKS